MRYLNLAILLITRSISAKVNNFACHRSETRFYSHNDVQEIVKFIASKDCKLSEEHKHSEYFSKLSNHGCWCNSITGQNQHGEPVDEIDKSCRKWHTCQKCSQKESCNSDSEVIFEINYNALDKSFSCLSDEADGTSCSYDKCLCTLKLAVEVYSEIKLNDKTAISDHGNSCSNIPRPMLRFGQQPPEYDRCCKDEFTQKWVQYDSGRHYCDERSGGIRAISEKPLKFDKEADEEHIFDTGFAARRRSYLNDEDLDYETETDKEKDRLAWGDIMGDDDANDDEEHSMLNFDDFLGFQDSGLMFEDPSDDTNGVDEEEDENFLSNIGLSIDGLDQGNGQYQESNDRGNSRNNKRRRNQSTTLIQTRTSGKDGEEEHIMKVITGDPICQRCGKSDRLYGDMNNLCFKKHPTIREKYYSCHHGMKTLMECVNGLVFDERILSCNLRYLVDYS